MLPTLVSACMLTADCGLSQCNLHPILELLIDLAGGQPPSWLGKIHDQVWDIGEYSITVNDSTEPALGHNNQGNWLSSLCWPSVELYYVVICKAKGYMCSCVLVARVNCQVPVP